MDALLLALMLTLVLDQGTTTQQTIARLGDSGTASASRIGGFALTVAMNAAIAAALGAMMAALLMPDARLLFLSIALLLGGTSHVIAPFRKLPAPNILHFRTTLRCLLGFAIRRAGENGAFAIAGVVAFTDAPILAAIGATLGGWVAMVPPLVLGSRYTQHPMLRLFQLLSGAILLCIAITCAVNALRIV